MDWQYRYDEPSLNRVQERWAAQFPPGSVGILKSGLVVDSESSDEVKVYRKLWWRKPSCWRDEQQIDGRGNSITVLCDGAWWAAGSSGVFYTDVPSKMPGVAVVQSEHPPALEDLIRAVPLLDPAFLLATHKLAFVANAVHADRPVIQVRATYQKGKNSLHEAFFWASADQYNLLVDQEYGILLRYAALLDGQEFAVASVENVVFDAPIPDEVFAFPSVS
jgi:hypothetical protein